MKRVKWQREGFGELKVINIISLGILITLNIMSIVFEGRYNLSPILITSILLLILVISIVFSPKNISPLIYLIVGSCMVFDASNISDFSPAIFYIFSFHAVKKRCYGMCVLALSLILITAKALITGDTVSGIVIMIIAYAYIYTTYYFLIYKQPKNTHLIDTIKITDEERDIIKLYSIGYTYEEINEVLKLNITNDTVRRKIKKVKDQLGCINDIEFGKRLHESV